MVSPVMVQTMMVSMKVPVMETYPCRAGSSVVDAAAEIALSLIHIFSHGHQRNDFLSGTSENSAAYGTPPPNLIIMHLISFPFVVPPYILQ